MKTVFIASGNNHKVSEIQSLLHTLNFKVFGLKDLDSYVAPEETGSTFLENAFIKAKALQDYFLKQNKPLPYILADDSGIICEDLDNAPGIYSARFAGPNATDADNNKKLIAELQKLENPTLQAHYVCALVWLTPENQKIELEETCHGKIVFEPKGENGFGYDPYFYLESLQKTMAEISSEQKNSISHRAKALQSLLQLLDSKPC